uniref:Uncharacterized protein n=1 Tax=Oryza glumipatula TaxID=40148 RepID=A0A0D9Y7U3_9ORYZ
MVRTTAAAEATTMAALAVPPPPPRTCGSGPLGDDNTSVATVFGGGAARRAVEPLLSSGRGWEGREIEGEYEVVATCLSAAAPPCRHLQPPFTSPPHPASPATPAAVHASRPFHLHLLPSRHEHRVCADRLRARPSAAAYHPAPARCP